jgi:catechol 2,3-dioxygenase-like lactoylglutathione lyase family enzyme
MPDRPGEAPVPELDHLILPVTDATASAAWYHDVIGLETDGTAGPFTVLRVSPSLTIQLAPFGTDGGHHLAFAFQPAEFEAAFARIRASGAEYGDSFHSVGNMRGPGREPGARGEGPAVYVFDPDRHLVELRTTDA